MKRAISEARMIESESKAMRQTMEQGVLNIQTLSSLSNLKENPIFGKRYFIIFLQIHSIKDIV